MSYAAGQAGLTLPPSVHLSEIYAAVAWSNYP